MAGRTSRPWRPARSPIPLLCLKRRPPHPGRRLIFFLILSCAEAFEHKLIAGIRSSDYAFSKAKELGNAPDAKVVKYGPPFSLGRFLRIFGGSDSKIELQLPRQLLPQLESGRAYFLPSYYAP